MVKNCQFSSQIRSLAHSIQFWYYNKEHIKLNFILRKDIHRSVNNLNLLRDPKDSKRFISTILSLETQREVEHENNGWNVTGSLEAQGKGSKCPHLPGNCRRLRIVPSEIK